MQEFLMYGQSLKEHELNKERIYIMQNKKRIMLNITEILLNNNLISPDEKYQLIKLIRKDEII